MGNYSKDNLDNYQSKLAVKKVIDNLVPSKQGFFQISSWGFYFFCNIGYYKDIGHIRLLFHCS